MRIVDPVTGDSSTAYLFVAVLPFSRYAFVEPTLDMAQNSWLRAHVAMYEWFGGSTPRLVCDNLKTGVIKHPREGEVVLNDAYRGLAEHYSAAVLPGRVRKPKDKPSAENTVWHATMALAGAMRDHQFGSLDELRTAIRAWLVEYNSRPFQKRDGSRLSVFEGEEKPLLIALPPVAYEVMDWVYGRRVQANSHVAYARNWYSVPYAYVGSTVDLRIGANTLEIRRKNTRLCTHRLLPASASNKYSTNGADLSGKTMWRPWDRKRCEQWANRIGPTNRRWTPRWRCCACRNGIPRNGWRTRARWRCSRSPRPATRISGRSSNPARISRARSPTTPAITAPTAGMTVPVGCAAATATRTWAGETR